MSNEEDLATLQNPCLCLCFLSCVDCDKGKDHLAEPRKASEHDGFSHLIRIRATTPRDSCIIQPMHTATNFIMNASYPMLSATHQSYTLCYIIIRPFIPRFNIVF